MTRDNIVDSADWLRERAEALSARRDPQAELYWRRLLNDNSLDEVTRRLALTQLGIGLFRRGATEDAESVFLQLEPTDDGFASYALGQCKLATGRPASALVLFLKAFVEGGTAASDEAPEYLRSAGVALRDLNMQELALSVTLGALERDPTRPTLLEALGVQYERMERWVDAIRARDTLIELLKSNLPVHFRHEPELDMAVIAPAKAEDDVRAINERLRRQFAVILPDDEVSEADYAMSLSNYPPGLQTLVAQLSARQNSDHLLEVSQRLWAVARHDGLGEHLRPEVLAATVQWLAERLTWRPPTSHEVLKEAYGVESDQIRAAARLLVSRYDSPLLPISALAPRLSPSELTLLRKIVTAILLDVGLEEVEPRTLF